MNKNTKYKEILNNWLELHKYQVKESSYSYYKTIAKNHLLYEIGDLKIKDITNTLAQSLIIEKSENGNKINNSGLSYNTLRDIILVFKLSMKYAIKLNCISTFDFSFVIPNRPTKELQILDIKEQKKLYNFLISNPTNINIGILIAQTTGLRIGEICALTYGDIDFKRSIVSITKTGQRINSGTKTKIIITTPKSHKSIREIPIDKNILNLLKNTRSEFYILSGSTKFIEPRRLRSEFNKILSLISIKQIKFHSLRHTFATSCIELGCDYKAVSDILGHSNINTTINLYVHPKIEHKKKATNKFVASLN